MRPLLEADIERKHRKVARAAGWFVEKILRAARGGFPDRFYAHGSRCEQCGRGRVVLVEWKRKGKRASPQQLLRHRQLRAAGIEVYVVDSLDDANQILGIHDSHRGVENQSTLEVEVSRRDRARRLEDL